MTTPSEEEARAAAEKYLDDLSLGAYLAWPEHQVQDGISDFIAGAMWAASRVSTPPSEDILLVDVKLGREYEPPNWEGSELGGWFAHVESARVVSGNLSESVRALAEPYSSELDYDERVQEAVAEYIAALPAVPVLPTEPEGRCPKCGVKVTDQTPSAFYVSHDETCGGDLSEPTEPDAEALTEYMEDWYDRWAGPGETWVVRDLAESLIEDGWAVSAPPTITDEAADRAQIAMHEFCFGDGEPLTRRQLGIARQGWKVAIAAALGGEA